MSSQKKYLMTLIFFQPASPFKFAKSSKNKITVFQTPLKSVQEAEGQKSEDSQESGTSQEADCCKLIVFLVQD